MQSTGTPSAENISKINNKDGIFSQSA